MDCNKSLLLHVRMFGKFELEYKGELIDLRFGQTTKVMQILQILLYKFPRGVPTTALLEYLFEYDEVLNPRNNLKVSISQLRRRLTESPVPGDRFIQFQNGSYRWDADVDIQVDAHEFERLVKMGNDS